MLIEDVVSSGGQIIDSAGTLRDAGAIVADVLCVLVRDPAAHEKLTAAGLRLFGLLSTGDMPVPDARA